MTSRHGLPTPSIHHFWCILASEPTLVMQRGARILHISGGHLGVPGGQPTIEVWAHVDVDAPRVPRRLRVVETGHLADVDPDRHLGTVITDGLRGREVRHVFDLGEEDPDD